MSSIADIRFKHLFHTATVSACLSLALFSNVNAADDSPAAHSQASGQALYAKVGDREITVDEYNQTYDRAVRKRYYHSKPPEDELDTVRQEIADELITRELLLLEASRSGLQADEKSIQATLDQYERRYANSPRWKEQRVKLLAALKPKLEQDDLLRQLENRVKNVAPPSEKQLRSYYRQYPEKFTEPMQQKLSLILLVVDPSSSSEVWQAALDKGQGLVEELHKGADFADLARMYSSDVSAERGGDMGYVHREMLSEAVEKTIDDLQPGQISDAIRTLQGVAILRLDDRKAAHLREFADVRDRARKLWVRDHSETAWSEFKAQLRLDTPVKVFVNVANSDNDV